MFVALELDDGLGLDGEGAVLTVEAELVRLCVRDGGCCDVLLPERSASDGAVDSLNIHWKSVDAIWKDIVDDMIILAQTGRKTLKCRILK